MLYAFWRFKEPALLVSGTCLVKGTTARNGSEFYS